MAQIISLSAARKARARAAARAAADANVTKFGRSKAEKAFEKAQADKTARDLDGHEREPD